jgi:arylsulfatase A
MDSTMRCVVCWFCVSLVGISFLALGSSYAFAAERLPNIVFIFCDNLGNGDLHCFNPETKNRTPNLDQLATEGMKLTSFYSASGVCTPSRAALMTGCYPRRIGMHASYEGHSVLKPVDKRGLSPEETTIAKVLKRAGYATACFGKWHLGDQHPFLPLQNGFDQYLGIPYSEDMMEGVDPNRPWPPLPYMKDNFVVEAPVDASKLTSLLTQASVEFIKSNRDRPFFLYFPETGPGSRRESFPGEKFRGKSANGLYGDSIEELDWSAGEIFKALRECDLDDNTLVIWTNDNGAVRRTPQHGSNAPYSGFGYSTSEGAMRMPCIVRWPGHIPAGTECRELCTMMDWLPTMARLVGQPLPNHPIDGADILPLLKRATDARSPYDEKGFFYYQVGQLQAVRAGPWKLYLPLGKRYASAKAAKGAIPQKLALYDVLNDVSEAIDVSAAHPEIIAKLTRMADQARKTIGDNDSLGTEQRVSGWVENPIPQLIAK